MCTAKHKNVKKSISFLWICIKPTTSKVGPHDVGAFGSPQWKKLKEIRFHLSEASWAYTAWSKIGNG